MAEDHQDSQVIDEAAYSAAVAHLDSVLRMRIRGSLSELKTEQDNSVEELSSKSVSPSFINLSFQIPSFLCVDDGQHLQSTAALKDQAQNIILSVLFESEYGASLRTILSAWEVQRLLVTWWPSVSAKNGKTYTQDECIAISDKVAEVLAELGATGQKQIASLRFANDRNERFSVFFGHIFNREITSPERKIASLHPDKNAERDENDAQKIGQIKTQHASYFDDSKEPFEKLKAYSLTKDYIDKFRAFVTRLSIRDRDALSRVFEEVAEANYKQLIFGNSEKATVRKLNSWLAAKSGAGMEDEDKLLAVKAIQHYRDIFNATLMFRDKNVLIPCTLTTQLRGKHGRRFIVRESGKPDHYLWKRIHFPETLFLQK